MANDELVDKNAGIFTKRRMIWYAWEAWDKGCEEIWHKVITWEDYTLSSSDPRGLTKDTPLSKACREGKLERFDSLKNHPRVERSPNELIWYAYEYGSFSKTDERGKCVEMVGKAAHIPRTSFFEIKGSICDKLEKARREIASNRFYLGVRHDFRFA